MSNKKKTTDKFEEELYEKEGNESPEIPSATTTADEEEGPARLFEGQAVLDHDLYKLKLQNLRRNMAIKGEEPKIEDVEHVHFFHSVDSSGRTQTRSTAAGGHFHVMELIRPAQGDKPAVYKAGPAMREVRRKFRGKLKKQVIPAVVYQDKDEKGTPVPGGDKIVDTHEHVVEYVRSSKIAKRVTNPEAVNVVAREAQLTAPIPGVVG